MNSELHWEGIYRTKAPDAVSWYRPHLDRSLGLIERAAEGRSARIVDVGAGESTLVDDLVARGYEHISVLDISPTALEVTKQRLGIAAARVNLVCADVMRSPFPRHCFDIWHDRAVFHFLTSPQDRAAYVQSVRRNVRPGGHVIVSTFGPEGPTRCSGLEVMRYDAGALHGQFGSSFRLVDSAKEVHYTPWGTGQQFTYCYCKVEDSSVA
ncbi:MAG: class I SAM-dependent methyltransferase [Bryobacteraceae bacterium]